MNGRRPSGVEPADQLPNDFPGPIIILDLLSSDLEPVFLPPRPGEILRSRASITRASKVLGWKPRVSLKEGLAKTISWFRSDLDTLRAIKSARSRRSVLRTRHPLTRARS